MNYFGGLRVYKVKVEVIHRCPNYWMLIGCKPSYACVIIIKGLLKGLVALLNINLADKN
jgi:hypothetical protein